MSGKNGRLGTEAHFSIVPTRPGRDLEPADLGLGASNQEVSSISQASNQLGGISSNP